MYLRIILLILFPLFAFSQSPQKINFQSILRNTNGEVVANKNVKLKISIQSGSMMDTTVYSETHLKTTDVSGLMSIKIGTGTVIMGRFDSIKWGKAPHFIKLEADFNGGNSFVLLGTQELMSVPYAFHSNTADSLVGGMNLKDIKDSLANLSLTLSLLKASVLKTQFFLNNINETPLTDIDGNTYQIVVIGSQIWMKENLKTTKYRNGDAIATGLDNSAWYYATTGAYAILDNNNANDTIYGKLYNWYAVSDPRGICPTGWHVPSDDEWIKLTNYLGGQEVAGGKMKVTGTTYWPSPNIGATNESSFSALPGSFRPETGNFYSFGTAFFWSSTKLDDESLPNFAYMVQLGNSNYPNSLLRFIWYNQGGCSIRCLMD